MQGGSGIVTFLIIGVTCVISIMGFSNPALVSKLILWPPAITRGKEYWRLITCGLIHADGPHLAVNMITLFFFGQLIERFYSMAIGPIGYLLFYIGGLAVSSWPSWYRHRNDSGYRSLGASGAVSAVLFSYILLKPWTTILLFFVVPMPAILYAVLYIGYSIYMDRQRRDNINHSAHLWGAIYGVVAMCLVKRDALGLFLGQVVYTPYFLLSTHGQ